jgi:peptidyl-dipeptidase Dcp
MKKNIIFALTALTACMNIALAAPTHSNPFSTPSSLPLEAPEFNKIHDSDYLPAFKQGMKEQLTEINEISKNSSPPTFENTIVAMEKSGRMLERVSEVFFAIVQANTNPQIDDIQKTIAPLLAEHHDKIYLNSALFARVKTLHDQQAALKLDPEAAQVLKIYYQQFVHAGALLNPDNKLKMQQLNQKIANLETSYQQKLLAASENAALVITDKTKLDGLTSNEIDALATSKENKNSYTISLQNTTQQPLLTSLKDRKTRELLFEHSWNRAERNDKNDTRAIIAELAMLRAEKAALLGYANYAAYTLYDQMAENPEAVHHFLNQLVPATANKTKEDAKEIQTLIDKENHFELQPWDWNYYSEQIRKNKFDVNQNEVKPYFELNQVLKNGLFYAATQLYGITFKERHDLPVYHPDVRVFEVYDQDSSLLGLFYIDYFQRSNKTGGAWMNNFVQQSSLLGTKPVVYNVTNFTKPATGQAALLTADDVKTMFHEFGHALHGLFAQSKYPLSNTNMARDFVELPSQFNEHWALYPDVLKHYAIHYKTGAPMPQALVDKILKAQTFNQGYSLGEILAAASLDMKWHELPVNAKKQDIDAFETQALKESLTDFPNVASRYRTSYFLHIWSNGYSAGYYAYLWTEMLEDDVYEWFTQNGGLTRQNGQRFRDLILSRGHTEDYDKMFQNFYGKAPSIEPMLKNRGL